MRDLKKISIWLVPILTISLQILYLFDIGKVHYFFWADPGYNYLLNGLNIAQGNWEVGHTDHPGSTLQIFCALIIRGVHWFRETDLTIDVISNPELYIRTIVMSIISIIFLLNLHIGKLSRKLGFSRLNSILFQTIPFCSFDAMEFSVNLMTEPMLIIGIQCLLILLLPFMMNYERRTRWIDVFQFAICIGFLLATKISALPLIAVPFFLFRKIQAKLVYLVAIPSAFGLIAIPLWFKSQQFVNFLSKIWGHSGQYGKGTEEVINKVDFISNFKSLLSHDWIFTVLIAIMIIVLIVHFLKRRTDNLSFVLLGVLIMIFGQLIMVAKHFSYHYFIPSLLMLPILIYAFKFYLKIGEKPFKILLIGVISFFTYRNVNEYGFFKGLTNPYAAFNQKYQNLMKTGPLVISGGVFGAFSAPSFRFGLAYSGEGRSDFTNAYKKIYPKNYFMDKNSNKVFDINESQFTLAELLEDFGTIYFYDRYKGQDHSQNRMKFFKNHGCLIELVDSNRLTNEVLLKLTNNAMKKYSVTKSYYSGIENFNSERNIVFSNDSGFTLNIGEEIDSLNPISGKYSLRLPHKDTYGLQSTIILSNNAIVRIKAKVKSLGSGEIVLVASPKAGGKYTSSQVKLIQNETSRISLKYAVNQKDTINFYFWNPKDEAVLIDDVSIEIREIIK